MAQLRQDYAEFVDRDAEVVAVGPDSAEAFRRFWAEQSLPFVGLADPDHVVATLYEQEVSVLKLGRMPALVVVDRAGRAAFRHYARSMSDIPSSATVLAELDKLTD